ncbi:penicillin-binding protein [Clostridium collagenovorans DSM 3089]|uniref:Penicillin-binding protein n=1 Tax=Clostridium collagenovorans DSM 3089 TaxID=1121306 RepID=A0A1M5VE42_9CLOT|nr:penicillin-binding transpeptidase domain-containing protein [Clostridium collagenovorans]SHH73451.1 penicillin-binding protein [Clostridium collagenovorans DSM 3089]
MRGFSKKTILGFMMIILISLFTVGCSKTDKVQNAFNEYKDKWIAKDFKSMYAMLSTESKAYITEEKFVERYNNIYDAIEANNIAIENNGEVEKAENENVLPFKLSMDTVAGSIDLQDYKVKIIKEDKEYKIKWDESLIFPKMIPNDKVRVDDKEASRGKILDRNNKELAVDGELSIIGIHPVVFDKENKEEKIKEMAETLDISVETIESKLNNNSNPDHFVPIVDILSNDEKTKKLSGRVDEGILIKTKKSRIYSDSEALGALVGYIGPVTEEELQQNSGKGYGLHSLIGKAGIEKVYEDTLKGKNGAKIYIERGSESIPIAERELENGKDVKLSIDSELQAKVYAEMNGDKGAATAVDPKTGEVLAMVTSPSYNSNVFTTYITKAQSQKWEGNKKADMENRFNDVYSPGSVMKLITATAGLDNGIIDMTGTKDIKGISWQKDTSWGGYSVTRVTDPGRPINLRDAVKYSDNIYFAQVALELGSEKYIETAKKFGIGDKLEFDYPMDNSQISNDGKLDKEILLADTAYGQGEVMVSPLEVALAYSALGNKGNIMNPRLVLSENPEAKVLKEKTISEANLSNLVEAFSAPIKDADGTAAGAKINGVNLAGKTGTAEIKSSQSDENGKEDAWFVALDTDDSKIVLSMIIEDVKNRGGSSVVIPKVKNSIEYYLNSK